eukprot:gene10735-4653_t
MEGSGAGDAAEGAPRAAVRRMAAGAAAAREACGDGLRLIAARAERAAA